MTTFEVTCFRCNGPIDFMHGDPTQPCCAGCQLSGDACMCPIGPERPRAQAAAEDREPEKYPPPPADLSKAESRRSPLLRWLRGSSTRRMFARALGDRVTRMDGPVASIVGGDNPTYLRMAAQVLDHVALELAKKPWADPTLVVDLDADLLAEGLHRVICLEDVGPVSDHDWNVAISIAAEYARLAAPQEIDAAYRAQEPEA
jgi:hypothetical protein